MKRALLALLALISILIAPARARNYKNFEVAVYCRVYEVREMKDPAYLESRWKAISNALNIDKVYLETHRDMIVVDQATLDAAKKFFADKGIKVAGGITATVNERNQFQTYCYSKPEQRRKIREVVEFTARNFDEIILDDFFFTNCKCDECIRAKGNKSWTRFRLDLMDEAGRSLVVNPGQPEGPDHDQVPELVRPFPESRVQSRDRTEVLRPDLHGHRNARRGV